MKLGKLLALSISLNVILGGILIFRVVHLTPPIPTSDPADSWGRQTHFNPPPRSNSFQWSELESDDYPTFIRNLHSIGCPEQTIRDIVTAEINTDFDQRIRDLQSKGLPAPQLRLAQEGLNEERVRAVKALFPSPQDSIPSLGVPQDKASIAANPDDRTNSKALTIEEDASMPLFYLQADSLVGDDGTKLNAWKNLKERFVTAIGGQYQNPYDPEYRNRWDQAQKDLDEAFHSQFGDDAFNQLLEQRKISENAAHSAR